MQRTNAFLIFTLALLASSACTTPQKSTGLTVSAKELKDRVCNIGRDIHSARGTVWFRFKTIQENSQFPASVVLDSKDGLKMEISNPLGSPEARIMGSRGNYSLTSFNSKLPSKRGIETWKGIPLAWGEEIMLGKFPCPSDCQAPRMDHESLVLECSKSTRLRYEFETIENNQLWPTRLDISNSSKGEIHFEFKNPDDYGAPLQWKVSSIEGEIKVAWKLREHFKK